MSPDILYTGTAAAGYIVGQTAHLYLDHKAHAEQRAIFNTLDAADRMLNPTNYTQTPDRKGRIGRFIAHAVAAEAIMLGVAGGATAMALSQEGGTHVMPHVEIVIDHSGPTVNAVHGKPTYDEINSVASQFAADKEAEANAIVTNVGSYTRMSVTDAIKAPALGDQDMSHATSLALQNAAQLNIQVGATKRNAAVVVITNGDSIGTKDAVEKAAAINTDQGQSHTPVFIVNAQGKDTKSPQVVKDLAGIAAATGGQYWDGDPSNLDLVKGVSAKVKESIEGYDKPTGGESNKMLLETAAGLLVLGAVGASVKTRYPEKGRRKQSRK